MKVVDILLLSSSLIGETGLFSALSSYKTSLESNQTPAALSADNTNKVNQMIACLNMTVDRLSGELIGLQKTESLCSGNDGTLGFLSFSEKVHEIVSAKDEVTGAKVAFEVNFDGIVLPTYGRRYLISYKYRPAKVYELNEDISLPTNLSLRLLALGTVSELLFVRNVFDEAKMWDEKFLVSVKNINFCSKERTFA